MKALLVIAALLAPLPAAAQDWTEYSYPGAAFAVFFPAPPTVSHGAYRTKAGLSVPATSYSVIQDGVAYVVTTADFTGTAIDKDAMIGEVVKGFGELGEIKTDVEARINRQYGRELSVARKDGGRSTVAVFFFNSRLYQLEGRAMPPDAASRTGRLIRFQQSLQFPLD